MGPKFAGEVWARDVKLGVLSIQVVFNAVRLDGITRQRAHVEKTS